MTKDVRNLFNYYNHALIPNVLPHQEANLSVIDKNIWDKKIFGGPIFYKIYFGF